MENVNIFGFLGILHILSFKLDWALQFIEFPYNLYIHRKPPDSESDLSPNLVTSIRVRDLTPRDKEQFTLGVAIYQH